MANGGNSFEIVARLHDTSSHVLLTLHMNMTMRTLRLDLRTAFQEAGDPNVDATNWPVGWRIHRIEVIWNSGIGHEQNQFILRAGNWPQTLRLLSDSRGVGYALNVVLGE